MTRVLILAGLVLVPCYAQGRSLPEIVADLKVANERQATELSDAKSRLTWTWNELNSAQQQINKVGVERDGWRAYGNSEHDKWMNAEKRVAEGKAGILRRDIIIGFLTMAISAWAVLKFYFHIPFL